MEPTDARLIAQTDLSALNRLDVVQTVEQRQAELDALRPLDPQLEQRVFQKLRLDWNYNSNAIEGNTLSFGETKTFLLHGLTAKGKPFKDHLDIRGHDEVIDHLLDLIRGSEPLTEVLIRELHKILLVEPYETRAETLDGQLTMKRIIPGQYKSLPNHVRTVTGQIHYYATPEATPARMHELLTWYRAERDAGSTHPLILATLFHHEFTAIHPFDDGNGRMARILSNLILMQQGFPPIIVHHERKSEYLFALSQADEGDPLSLIEYMGSELLHTLDLMIRAAQGEPIDELGDFDKRLALLKQRVESEEQDAEVQRSPEAVARVFEHVIQPLLLRLFPRFAQIDELFEQYQLYVTAARFANVETIALPTKGKTNAEPDTNRREALAKLALAIQELNVTSITFSSNWLFYRQSSKGRLSASLKFDFDLKRYLITIETSLIEGNYDLIPEPDIDQVAARILDKLYKDLERLSASS